MIVSLYKYLIFKKKYFLDFCYKVTFRWTLKVTVHIFLGFGISFMIIWLYDELIAESMFADTISSPLFLSCIMLAFHCSFQIIMVYHCIHNMFYFNIWIYLHIYIYSYLLLISIKPLFLILVKSFCRIHIHLNSFYSNECRNFLKLLFCPGKSQIVKQGV
jgi:hypothetical protein